MGLGFRFQGLGFGKSEDGFDWGLVGLRLINLTRRERQEKLGREQGDSGGAGEA